MNPTVGKILAITAKQCPDKVAVICDGNSITYGQLNGRVNQVAHGLLARGITSGNRVALLFYNSIELVTLYFALAKMGGVGIPLNCRLSGRELSAVINGSNATQLIMGEEWAATVNRLKPELARIKDTITVEKDPRSAGEFYRLYHREPDAEPDVLVKPEDASFIIYTSGTGMSPRGVVLTHDNHFWNTRNYTSAYQMAEDDVELALTPMFHASTLGRIVTYVFNGVTFVTAQRFDPERAMELIARHRVTSITQSPTMYAALLNLTPGSSYSGSSLRRLVSGAAPLFPSIRSGLAKRFPRAGIFDLYGLTEASPGVSILTPHDPPDKIASVGKPMKHVTVRIVDDRGREVPAGENGEIICRGPTIMKGYDNDPAATRAVLKGGWLYTGDTGKLDRDGYLYLTGRKKDLIVRGGENIYPAEVEAVLQLHPRILEAAVIGVPDDYWGERVKAFVVLRPGETLREEDVIAFCGLHLAHYKKPRSVAFVTDLPKNAAGKIVKRELLKKQCLK
jgi:acyl-CoA synthetase (AMP-forming)/AMP-acid ligase II